MADTIDQFAVVCIQIFFVDAQNTLTLLYWFTRIFQHLEGNLIDHRIGRFFAAGAEVVTALRCTNQAPRSGAIGLTLVEVASMLVSVA